jgi:hypothetical protein
MEKQDFTLYTYKADKRKKSGERLVSTRVLTNVTEKDMAVIVSASTTMLESEGYRFEFAPAMMTVKSLMTGQDVQIPTDTPWCCNPASETYWSM